MQLLRVLPSTEPTDNQSTSDHLSDPDRLFLHIQSLSIAVRANNTLIHELQSDLTGRGGRSGRPKVDRAVRSVENRLTELQRMVENDHKLAERRMEEIQLKLKQKSEEIEQLQQQLRTVERQNKDIQRSHQQSAYGDWTAGSRTTTHVKVCDSVSVFDCECLNCMFFSVRNLQSHVWFMFAIA